jgi:dTDP-glucose pyrophosphorylase
MWGIVPAGGQGSRIQPLAFSKELLPIGRRSGSGPVQPCAVSEYLVERMIRAGVERLCFVIAPDKFDILQYYGRHPLADRICYTTQPKPAGLCDAIFRALPFLGNQGDVIVGLPDTIWFPEDALCRLEPGCFSLLLFPVQHPERFDAVHTDDSGRVERVVVKQDTTTPWIWGAMRIPVTVVQDLYALWDQRGRSDEYLGTLINAYLQLGGVVHGVRGGETYLDVGTLDGFREAMAVLDGERKQAAQMPR